MEKAVKAIGHVDVPKSEGSCAPGESLFTRLSFYGVRVRDAHTTIKTVRDGGFSWEPLPNHLDPQYNKDAPFVLYAEAGTL